MGLPQFPLDTVPSSAHPCHRLQNLPIKHLPFQNRLYIADLRSLRWSAVEMSFVVYAPHPLRPFQINQKATYSFETYTSQWADTILTHPGITHCMPPLHRLPTTMRTSPRPLLLPRILTGTMPPINPAYTTPFTDIHPHPPTLHTNHQSPPFHCRDIYAHNYSPHSAIPPYTPFPISQHPSPYSPPIPISSTLCLFPVHVPHVCSTYRFLYNALSNVTIIYIHTSYVSWHCIPLRSQVPHPTIIRIQLPYSRTTCTSRDQPTRIYGTRTGMHQCPLHPTQQQASTRPHFMRAINDQRRVLSLQ